MPTKIVFLNDLEPIICGKQSNMAKTGNPVVQNWQPRWSYTILSASIQFLELKNTGLGRKVMFLSQLKPIVCRKHLNMGNLATLLYKPGNPVGRTLF